MMHRATCEVLVPIDEVPFKQRPRFTRSGRTYTPGKTIRFEAQIMHAWVERYGDKYEDFDGPVDVTIMVQRPLRKSNPKYWDGRQDLMKPDWDNIGKVVCDALNGIAYKDDAQIVCAQIRKLPRMRHGNKPSMRIRINYYDDIHEKEDRSDREHQGEL